METKEELLKSIEEVKTKAMDKLLESAKDSIKEDLDKIMSMDKPALEAWVGGLLVTRTITVFTFENLQRWAVESGSEAMSYVSGLIDTVNDITEALHEALALDTYDDEGNKISE